MNRVLELHNKTFISFLGLFISITGWFAWNLFLSAIYAQKPGPYMVRDAFLRNFGRNGVWWVTGIMVLSVLLVYELGVSSIRRIYFPEDEDLMQEMERYGKRLAQSDEEIGGEMDKAGLGDGGGDGLGSGGRRDSKVLVITTPPGDDIVGTAKVDFAHPTWQRRSIDASSGAAGGAAGAGLSISTAHNRRSRRLDDEYVPPPFTPPVEERENPFDFALPREVAAPTVDPAAGAGGEKKSGLHVSEREVSPAAGGSSERENIRPSMSGGAGSSPSSSEGVPRTIDMQLSLPANRRRGKSPGSADGPSSE
jgi:hypothetical protein